MPRHMFVSIIPRSPLSTLFPYTTLFRSVIIMTSNVGSGEINDNAPIGFSVNARHSTDRKSTRLNSSHVKISYAVFCLKKKKQQTTYAHRHNETPTKTQHPYAPQYGRYI